MSLQSEPMNEDVELLTFRHPNVLEILFQLILVRRGRETIDRSLLLFRHLDNANNVSVCFEL